MPIAHLLELWKGIEVEPMETEVSGGMLAYMFKPYNRNDTGMYYTSVAYSGVPRLRTSMRGFQRFKSCKSLPSAAACSTSCDARHQSASKQVVFGKQRVAPVFGFR
uniref:Uncharacterized protein n=1 Tax=Falco tinnunculus TaxID=100819 RepID=A0A8C4XV92_FALTI